MTDSAINPLTPGKSIGGLAFFLVLCFAVSALGAAVTATSLDSWYQGLAKPSFNPPDWIFPPVWTTLFTFMAIAAWRVWRLTGLRGGWLTFGVFLLQLALILSWSAVFFGMQRIDLALGAVVLFLLAIVANAVLFARIDRLSGLLFVPYVAWVAFAMLLNASILSLNQS